MEIKYLVLIYLFYYWISGLVVNKYSVGENYSYCRVFFCDNVCL